MADDKINRGSAGRARINVNEPYEMEYWSKKLRVSPEELKHLIATQGVMVKDVREALARK